MRARWNSVAGKAEPGEKANRQPSVVVSPRQLERKKKHVLKPAKRGPRVECTVTVIHGGGPQPYLKDVRVRQAINHALDRKLMSQALFGKFAEPSAQLQARGFVGYDARLEERYPYDPAKAKELLAAAGYPKGFELSVAYVNNSMSQLLQQAVGAQLRKVGITVKGMEARHFGVLRSMGDNKAFSAVVLNSNSGIPNLAKFQVLDAKGGFNYYGTTDDTLTRLMEEASNLPVDKAEDA
jgi:peptide/nickel transport system substrate-binding protein